MSASGDPELPGGPPRQEEIETAPPDRPAASAGLEPAGLAGPGDVDMLAAALRADTSDLATYERVLVATIADALPSGMVEIDRERSVGDRLAGRDGKVVAIRIHLGEATLELRSGRGGLTGVLARGVRGVTISRKEVPVSEWTRLLAEHLQATAVESAQAREALGRLLGAG